MEIRVTMDTSTNKFIELGRLEVYNLAREFSRLGWKIYQSLDWQNKKVIGDQMIQSLDSVGANIAEGYGRFHYLDKIRFYYNARGSLLEAGHWVELLLERGLISQGEKEELLKLLDQIHLKLNALINSQYKRKFGKS